MEEKKIPYLEGAIAYQVKRNDNSKDFSLAIVSGDIVLLSNQREDIGYIKVGSGKILFSEGSWLLKIRTGQYFVFTAEDFPLLIEQARKVGQTCYQYSPNVLFFTKNILKNPYLTC